MARTIAITGKGGVGKTTVAALIIRQLKHAVEGAILALDADPDGNLARLLGVEVEASIGDLREEALQEIRRLPAGMSKQKYIEAGLHQIVVETPKVDLISMGRGEGPGCYCFINLVLRKFAEDLSSSYEWVVMDNEAGLEHLSRRTASHIDDLVVVVNGSPLAIDSARRIARLAGELHREVRRRYFLLNAVEEGRAAKVKQRMSGLELEYLGAIPRDEALEELADRGQPIDALANGPALNAIREVMQAIGAG